MERKRELSSVDLRALAAELGAYEGAKVDKAYLYGDDLLRLKLRDFDRGRIELFVEVGEIKRAHLVAPERVPDAPGRPPGFAKMLRNRLSGADFVGAEQYEFDRIVEFTFEREDGTTTIVAELFGDGNIAVLDSTGEVVDCLETVRLKSRTVVPGSQYEYPDSRLNPLSLSEEGFVARMDESDTDVVRTIATQLNFGGEYAEELCTRAGVPKTLAIEDASEQQYEALYETMDALRVDLRTGAFEPRVYSDEGGDVVDVSPLPLEERSELDAEPFDTFNDALDEYFFDLERIEDEPDSTTDDEPEFDAEIETQQRIIEQQQNAIEDFEAQAGREREKAELLYAEYDLVDGICSTIREARQDGRGWDEIEERFETGAERGIDAAQAVSGVNPENGTVIVTLDEYRIELDPSEGVEKNANRLYQEAKRIEEKKEGAKEAIEDTRERLEAIRERKRSWEASDEETDDSNDETEKRVDWLSDPSIPVRQTDQWYERFRWFHTSDGFLVIGGRDADQNEELVKKYLEPGDQFFHTQAHGGPATILKATDPSEAARDVEIPESSRREAATFAVSYSSIWKDGRFAGDVYTVDHDQVSKTPESGEYLEKGGFAIRGDREYFDDVPVAVAVGITCEPETRVVGGPPTPIEKRAETTIEVEPGRYAQGDVGKRIYRTFREHFEDTSFVRKVASPDLIQHFLPPGGSRILEE